MTDKIEDENVLLKYYWVIDKGTRWHLLCKRCDDAWSLQKEGLSHGGNTLFLLNHARSHDSRE
jgi:hypothetical protein